MPLLYEPATGSASETFTSGDGVVTVVTDPANAGVLIRVQGEGSWCTLWRTDPEGQAVTVRSGDPCVLVYGEGHAYDHETRPGVAYAYHVTLEDGSRSQAVTVTVPWLDPVRDCWIKVVAVPSLSTRVRALEFEESWDSRTGLVPILSGGVHATLDSELPLSGSLTVSTRDKATHDAVVAALSATSVLLIQATEAHGLPDDLYVVRTSRSKPRPGNTPGYELRHHVAAVQEVVRPVTAGAPLAFPGWSWSDATRGFANMVDVAAAYPTVWDMLLAGVR